MNLNKNILNTNISRSYWSTLRFKFGQKYLSSCYLLIFHTTFLSFYCSNRQQFCQNSMQLCALLSIEDALNMCNDLRPNKHPNE